jgi:polysaccharide export outer membrane protein
MSTWFRSVSSSATAEARGRRAACAGFFAALATVTSAWSASALDEALEIRVGLPSRTSTVEVGIGDGGVTLDLPAGSLVPLDFLQESGGFVRGGNVTPAKNGRMQLSVTLGSGYLDGVRYEPEAVVLRLRRRSAAASPTLSTSTSYRLGPEDRIQLSVSGQPELTQTLVVGRNGRITLPYLGEVDAAGRTPPELAARVAELLARDFLVDPKVDLQVLEYRSQWVMVSGEVRNPGKLPLRGGTNLKEVLSEAGGLTPNAGPEILVTREGADGKPEVTRVARDAFERGEVDPVLRSGDIVSVGKMGVAYVYGEVRNPGGVRLDEGLTLLRALALAGGVTEWANRKSVQILSEGVATAPRVFDLRDIEDGKTQDPLLRPGDVVTIKRRFL